MPIDYSKYPDNWMSEIRPRILKRAGNCCEICGEHNKIILYSYKLKVDGKIRSFWTYDFNMIKRYSFKYKLVRVVLTIAHLDHDEDNHNVTDDRLKAMCQYCHLNYDLEEKWRRRKNAKNNFNSNSILSCNIVNN